MRHYPDYAEISPRECRAGEQRTAGKQRGAGKPRTARKLHPAGKLRVAGKLRAAGKLTAPAAGYAVAVLLGATMAASAAPAASAASRPAGTTGIAIAATPGMAAPASSVKGPIYSRLRGICLTAGTGQAGASLVVAIRHCSGDIAQQWTLPPDNTIRIFGRCLDIRGTGSASRVMLVRCRKSPGQFWETRGVIAIPGVQLINPGSGMCLEAPGGVKSSGIQVRLGPCAWSAAQTWYPPTTPRAGHRGGGMQPLTAGPRAPGGSGVSP